MENNNYILFATTGLLTISEILPYIKHVNSNNIIGLIMEIFLALLKTFKKGNGDGEERLLEEYLTNRINEIEGEDNANNKINETELKKESGDKNINITLSSPNINITFNSPNKLTIN
jgi:hypothetical protein